MHLTLRDQGQIQHMYFQANRPVNQWKHEILLKKKHLKNAKPSVECRNLAGIKT